MQIKHAPAHDGFHNGRREAHRQRRAALAAPQAAVRPHKITAHVIGPVHHHGAALRVGIEAGVEAHQLQREAVLAGVGGGGRAVEPQAAHLRAVAVRKGHGHIGPAGFTVRYQSMKQHLGLVNINNPKPFLLAGTAKVDECEHRRRGRVAVGGAQVVVANQSFPKYGQWQPGYAQPQFGVELRGPLLKGHLQIDAAGRRWPQHRRIRGASLGRKHAGR